MSTAGAEQNDPWVARDLGAAAEKVLVAAYDRKFEEELAPELVGKRPIDIRLDVFRTFFYEQQAYRSLEVERLSTHIFDPIDIIDLARFPGDEDPDPALLEYYKTMATELGGTSLRSCLVVPPGTVFVEYAAHTIDGRDFKETTLREQPDLILMANATSLASLALEYIDSDEFFMDPTEAKRFAEREGENDYMAHQFVLRKLPDMPLSGLEDKSFLEDYKRYMWIELQKAFAAFIKKMEKHAPEEELEDIQKEIDIYRNAYENAKAALGRSDQIEGGGSTSGAG